MFSPEVYLVRYAQKYAPYLIAGGVLVAVILASSGTFA